MQTGSKTQFRCSIGAFSKITLRLILISPQDLQVPIHRKSGVTYNGLLAANALLLAVLCITGLAFFIHRAHAAPFGDTAAVQNGNGMLSAHPNRSKSSVIGNSTSKAPQKPAVSVLGLAFGIKESKRYEEVVLPKNTQMLPLLQASKNIDPQAKTGAAVLVVADTALSGDNIGASGSVEADGAVPTSDQISVYTVRPGDTPEQIARMYNVNVATIRAANDLSPTEKIQPNQVLVILPVPGIIVTTKVKGDTINAIAKKRGANASKVAAFNDIPADEALDANVSIIIPEDSMNPAEVGNEKKPVATKKTKTVVALKTSGSSRFSCPIKDGVITQGLHDTYAVDIGAPANTPVYAAADGIVKISLSGTYGGGWGTYVLIDHSPGQTLYAHLNAALVSSGDRVVKGQLIGRVGRTGRATGNHLHIELRGGFTNNICNHLPKHLI